ncbi:hypothetical protein ABT392_07825 [Paucibacter sp. JuS9]|uniref:hypothetical protein n=1 Tax=Paucibacter sp. JuS9 TaxID=3228748 RepID=UPI003757057A
MPNFELRALVAMYRRMATDTVPDRALADEIRQVVSGLTSAQRQDLDRALQAAGIDGWLTSAAPVADDGAWLADDEPVQLTEELRRQGRAYLEEMLAKGPAGTDKPR